MILNYFYAQGKVTFVATIVAKLLLQMHNDKQIDLKNCVFVGFSLGAHIMGIVARLLKKEGIVIPAIIALDPAKPLFSEENMANRICRGDASYIEAIHTSTDWLGFRDALWDVDIYVNGGHNQPSCRPWILHDWFGKCSHSFAVDVLTMSLTSEANAILCNDYEAMERGELSSRLLQVGGLHPERKRGEVGIFRFNTVA